jgi:hypothetical protein
MIRSDSSQREGIECVPFRAIATAFSLRPTEASSSGCIFVHGLQVPAQPFFQGCSLTIGCVGRNADTRAGVYVYIRPFAFPGPDGQCLDRPIAGGSRRTTATKEFRMKKSFKALSAVAALEFLRAPGFSQLNRDDPKDFHVGETGSKNQNSVHPILITAAKPRKESRRSERGLKIVDAG